MNSTFDEQLQKILRKVYSGNSLKEKLLRLQFIYRVLKVRTYEELLLVPQNESVPTDVRCLACWLLCHLGKNKALPELEKVFASSGIELKICIAESLSHLMHDAVVDILIEGLRSDNEQVRKASAYSLGNVGMNQIRASEISDHLHKVILNEAESSEVRTQAVESVGLTRVKDSVPILVDLLQHNSPQIRFWAANALGRMGDESVIPDLQKLAETDESAIEDFGSVSDEAEYAIQRILNSLASF